MAPQTRLMKKKEERKREREEEMARICSTHRFDFIIHASQRQKSIRVTRSLTRALKIIGIVLPTESLPKKIRQRRNTCPLPRTTIKPGRRSARSHTLQIDCSPLPPNEWCICRRSSFGNMIFCDNPTCLIKWFHMDCLGMGNTIPSGQWFCQNCALLQP
ncbi:inhibitor of growth protein 4-like [Sitodiplosis mosellana]|uniref:inhibitor of growth protein 4-like n=1 Tax=Sitodiplosis mosellana TaxID=263140 RepID=UPI00244467E7|nr:inhibitor of growth protein 4-like [Sitodiplosis mosellana]